MFRPGAPMDLAKPMAGADRTGKLANTSSNTISGKLSKNGLTVRISVITNSSHP
jgi:hypothetical protein